MKKYLIGLTCCLLCSGYASKAQNSKPLSVALAGLNHDHVYLMMQHYKKGDVNLVGIAEPDKRLVAKFEKEFHIPDSLFYPDVKTLLAHVKPEVVMAFDPINEHVDVVKTCAPLHVNVMVEKPLATTVQDAEMIASLAKQYNIHVLTDYETEWYATNHYIYNQVRAGATGNVIKMIAHDGHQGPKEIGCSSYFLDWLTDPVKNGAGALNDFGCYGANLFTWLMDNQMPVAVSAVTHQIKPAIYPKVDDDATILVEYPHATGIIEASWNWPFSIKDWEVFGKTGYLQAVNSNMLRTRDDHTDYETRKLDASAAPYQDYVPYVTAILRGEIEPGDDLSSLKNNVIVVKILTAAKESARTGKKVVL